MKRTTTLAACLLVALSCSGEKRAKQVEQAQLRYQMAQSLLQKGETTQGLSELIAAAELDPKNAEIQNLLGLTFLGTDRPEKAEEAFKKAIQLDPNYSEARNNYATLLIVRGRYDEAAEQCTKAIENITYATPERAYHNMGVAYRKKGDRVKAHEAFRKALVHNSNFVLTRKELGQMAMEEQKYQEAAAHLETASKACAASPAGAWGADCPEVHYDLAMAQLKLKNRAKAVAAFRSCVDADQQGTYGQKCRDNLKILE